jgi:hypothetical protein
MNAPGGPERCQRERVCEADTNSTRGWQARQPGPHDQTPKVLGRSPAPTPTPPRDALAHARSATHAGAPDQMTPGAPKGQWGVRPPYPRRGIGQEGGYEGAPGVVKSFRHLYNDWGRNYSSERKR